MQKQTPCSLEAMLEARDRRRKRQQEHYSDPAAPALVVATVVAPGEYKQSYETSETDRAMSQAMLSGFAGLIVSEKHFDYVSGPETWIGLSCTAIEAKRMAVAIEENHPLGRLFDIDVIGRDLVPVSRGSLGLPPRRCLLCGEEARMCMRSHAHSLTDIKKHVSSLVRSYIHDEHNT